MSNATTNPTVQGVIEVLAATLGIEDRADSLDETTPLFGELPELDSLAVVELATALEDRFAIEIDDDAFSAEVFETVASLAAFIDSRH